MSDRSAARPSLLLATSIPYWRQRRGSDQRIASLVRALSSASWDVTTFYVSEAPADLRNAFDKEAFGALIEADAPLPADYYVADPPLSRFTNHGVFQQFGSIARAARPDVVLIEYIELSYLADALPTDVRNSATLAIDTHDVMHQRFERFAEVGRPHWVKISRDEEAAALTPFDIVIAISEEDARQFTSMCPGADVVTALHAVDMPDLPVPAADESAVRFGFLGVGSQPNIDAAGYLLREVWPSVYAQHEDCLLTIAGEVGNRVRATAEDCPGVVLTGEVPSLDSFYRTVDVVLNPVSFGGGLKIKNVEALAHACALVTSPIGAEGLGGAPDDDFLLATDRLEWIRHACALAKDQSLRARLGAAGRTLAERRFSSSAAYGPLLSALAKPSSMRASA